MIHSDLQVPLRESGLKITDDADPAVMRSQHLLPGIIYIYRPRVNESCPTQHEAPYNSGKLFWIVRKAEVWKLENRNLQ